MKRRFSMRVWLIGGIIAMVLAAYLGVGVLAGLNELLTPNTDPLPPRSSEELASIFAYVETQPARWEDWTWRADLKKRLESARLGLTLVGPDERVVFWYDGPNSPRITAPVYGPVTFSTWADGRLDESRVYVDGKLAGKAVWTDIRGQWLPDRQLDRFSKWIPVLIVIVVGGTIWLFTTLASRAVLKPLGAISAAAHQINQGDLSVTVPTSPVTELNEFARAFAAMRDGLKASLDRQAALEQERRLFVAALAHDLRTPLTSVRGYLEGVRDGVARTPEMLERYVQVALEKTAALERLVDGFFSYSRTEYLSQPPQQEPLDLGALLAGAVAGMRPQALAKSVELRLDEGPEPCIISGDAAMLQRVVDNLLDNALRYTPPGGTVEVGWRGGLDHGRFWVQDSGPGIPPADLERVFEPLYRADKARGSRTGGAGLGLAIARRLVAAHGGTISAENRDGARFTVTLPIKP